MIDYHLHTRLCKHASGDMFEYVEQAIVAGLSEIAFTDHMPMPDKFDSAHRMAIEEMDTYQNWVAQAKKKYPQINILFGIEADFYPGYENFTEHFLRQYDFDLVIMSVHFIRHWPQGHWVFNYDFPQKSISEIYQEYLSTLQQGVKTGLYDLVGHFDLIKNPGHALLRSVKDTVLETLQIIKNSGMAMEINTSGYRKTVGESYPPMDWLPVLRDLEIPLTTGSDAHAPDQVGLRFRELYNMLNAQNIEKLARFKKRNMILQAL